ncbi:hypothetical protein Tco_0592005, partial [Tanacetum coccineum]
MSSEYEQYIKTDFVRGLQHTTPLELPLDVEEGVFNDEVQMNEAT